MNLLYYNKYKYINNGEKMNIDFLKQLLFSSRIDEVRILGKNKEIDGVVCNIAALVRYGRELRLIILAYDENFQNQIE